MTSEKHILQDPERLEKIGKTVNGKCRRCVTFDMTVGKQTGYKPTCAFHENGTFNPKNDGCETIGALRDLVRDDKPSTLGWASRDDVHSGSVTILHVSDCANDILVGKHFPGSRHGEILVTGYLVMTYSQNEYATSQAVIIGDGERPKDLTLEQAEAILESLGLSA